MSVVWSFIGFRRENGTIKIYMQLSPVQHDLLRWRVIIWKTALLWYKFWVHVASARYEGGLIFGVFNRFSFPVVCFLTASSAPFFTMGFQIGHHSVRARIIVLSQSTLEAERVLECSLLNIYFYFQFESSPNYPTTCIDYEKCTLPFKVNLT